jgi:hypothetical protein
MKDNKNLDNLLKEAETSKKLDNLLSVLDSKEPLEESKKLPAAVYYAKYKKKQAEAQQAVAAEREAFLKARSQKKEEAKQDPNAGSIVEEEDTIKKVSIEVDIDGKSVSKDGSAKVELEPPIKAPEEPEDYNAKIHGKEGDDIMKKENEALKAIEESMKGIFSILKGAPLKEEDATDLGDAAAEPVHDTAEAKEVTPEVTNDDVLPADEHKQAEDVKEVVVENEELPVEVAAVEAPLETAEEAPVITINTDEVKVTIPVTDGEVVNSEITPEQQELVAEAFASIYKVFARNPLNEEEAVEVPENAEAEVEVEDGKLVVTIHVDHPTTEVKPEDEETLDKAVEVIESVLVGNTSLGDAAAEPVHDTTDAKEHTPEVTNDDVLPADEHKQAEDVKEVVVENVAGDTNLGDAAAEPVHDDSAEKEHTPDVENSDVYTSDEHKQAEDVKEVVVENETPTIEIHTDAVEVTIPLSSNQEVVPSEEITPEQQELVAEAFATIYKAFAKRPLNEEETVEVPEDAEANVEVEDGNLIITINVDQPVAEISDDKSEEVSNAVGVIESILVGDTDLGDAAAEPVHNDKAAVEHTPEVTNDDVLPADEHKQAEDVKEVIVEAKVDLKKGATKLNDAAHVKAWKETGVYSYENGTYKYADGTKASKEDVSKYNKLLKDYKKEKAYEGAWKATGVYSYENGTYKYADGTKASKEDIVKFKKAYSKLVESENVAGDTDLGDAAATPVHTDAAPAEHTPDVKNDDVYTADSHEQAEEVKEVVVENETPVAAEVPAVETPVEPVAAEEVAEVEDDAHAEVKVEDGRLVITIDTDEVKSELSDTDSAKLEEAVNLIHRLVTGKTLSEADTEELNDAGSDTVNRAGDLENPSHEEPKKALPSDVTTAPAVATPAEKEPVKATPADVTEAVKYKSLKEAFLLENGYFDKDSVETVSAQAKRDRLLEQLALLTARDSKDPLYEELLQSTVVAKRIQKKLQEKYTGAATKRAEQMFSLRQERKN